MVHSKKYGVNSAIHRAILMKQIEEFINGRNYLHLFFKQLPQNSDFQFYHMVFEHHGLNRRKIRKVTNGKLLEMGIMNPQHRKILLEQIAFPSIDLYEHQFPTERIDDPNKAADANSHEKQAAAQVLSDEEEESTLGSDFMDEIYHTPKNSLANIHLSNYMPLS
eukprot:TRINITY_DN3464_c0_g1_i1.p1 TRINITY_DN3464_c0_g1~~TRINITY_DN3464_c0_g1_i1.p1  ORF type:complete len:164 (-),score=20.72 TRINITY_DN3464_c0_g1_i1:214-705(-)